MKASPAAHLPTAGQQDNTQSSAASPLGAWQHHGPSSSSASASDDRLTPDSDSEDDAALLFSGDAGGEEEAYELKSRTQPGSSSSSSSRRSRLHPAKPPYTPQEETAVLRKLDRRLVTFLAFCYMLSFLDRSNIGNAFVAGMDDDLQSVPANEHYYEYALQTFYLAYIAFEWMSLLWRVIPAHIYVSAVVLSWGLLASLQAVAVNYPMLILLRGLLGVGEAAFTGVPYYLSFFFRREELAFRTAVFVSAAPLATMVATWLTGAIFFLANMAYSSLPVFLPTILTQMGHSPLSSQALAAPPYLAAFFIVLATAHISDRTGARSPLLIAAALTSAVGYAVLALSTTFHLRSASLVRYLAVYPAAAGFFTVVVLTIAWSVNNQADESKRGGGFALLQVLGQCGPLVGARLYPAADGPFYTSGMSVCACAMLGVAALAAGLRWWLQKLNKRLDEEEGVEELERNGEEEMGLVDGRGKGRRKFRYML
ncbi:hypothetical protein DL546_008282 [Coniochaeta pulveracea]|uniref:Major facilitator superfamily (MFS) profile domain-containing protein n=1 Tax=Coniochaeta pulveracea TaxID=177199 RepID=A0A420YDA0_9PEZI|nr:hypothetical protein DL546_008282 [Coniochaeta pulveracea]